MIVRGIVTASDAAKGCQEISADLMDEEPRADIPVMEQSGVSFRAHADAEMLVIPIGGSDNNLAAIGTSGRGKRPTDAIEEGEGGLYFAGVFRVFLKADGTTLFGAMDATEAMLLGDLTKTAYDAHTHATPFGPTGAPVTPLPSSCLSSVSKVK